MEAISSLAMDNQQPRDMGETKKKRKTVGIETKHHWDMVIETTTLVQTTCWCVCYGVFFGGPRQHFSDQVSKAAHCLQEQLNVFDLCTFRK